MELSIIRRESTGVAPNQYNESETITKFEIMDGAPVRVLIDEENRRYFKQQEMILFTDFGAFVLFILTLLDMCCKSIDDSEEHKEIAGGATMAALSTYKGAQGLFHTFVTHFLYSRMKLIYIISVYIMAKKVWCSFGEMLQDIHAMLFDGVCDQAKSAYGE
ncbi:hypothetical protein BSLG_003344 [Batrachochytrium salamandrivorans]|nr:hypothetical protein BSLG_003344 [Batrachochytrium salamandrivorans]